MSESQLGPNTARLLALVREEAQWLRDAGYTESPRDALRSSFSVTYASDKATVRISLDYNRLEFNISLAPPGENPVRFTCINAFLGMYGLPLIQHYLGPTIDDKIETVRAAISALRGLRSTELSGDWSRLEAARSRWSSASECDMRERPAESRRPPPQKSLRELTAIWRRTGYSPARARARREKQPG